MSKFGFDRIITELKESSEELMKELANNAKDYFINNFNEKSFNKESWPSRKPNKYDDGHPLLEKTGELKSAVENPEIQTTDNSYEITVDNEYGQYHNEGTENLPKREWMGESEELNKMQESIIIDHVNKIFNQ